jgi:hypothetical protein
MKTKLFAKKLFEALVDQNGGFCTRDEKTQFEEAANEAAEIASEKFRIGKRRTIRVVPFVMCNVFSFN